VTADSCRAQRGDDSAPRDRSARVRHRVDEHDVALIDEQDAAMRAVPRSGNGRRAAPLVVGEPAKTMAVAVDDPRGRLVVSGPPPFEVEARGITGPAQSCLRVADKFRPAHDAVDGEREGAGGAGERHDGRGDRSKSEENPHEKPQKRGAHYTIGVALSGVKGLNRISPPHV
jgi:hypothetical protein